LKALNKEPARRYSSAEALADDLRRHRAGLPVLARDSTHAYRALKFIRRHRAGVGASAAILLSCIAGLAGISWQAYRATPHLSRAVAAEHLAAARAALAEQTTESLVDVLGDADPYAESSITAPRPAGPAAMQFLHRGELRLERLRDPALRASLMAALARA